MKGIDTNVLVRFLVKDDAEQYRKARAFLTTTCTPENPGYISQVVLCELIWVLRAAYKNEKREIVNALEKILRTRQFAIQRKEDVYAALGDFQRTKADFSDCLIARVNKTEGCEETVTFDRAASTLNNVRLL